MTPNVYARLILTLKAEKGHEMRQKIRQGDLVGANFALGGEICLEKLERDIQFQAELIARLEKDAEQKQQQRTDRRAARKANRAPRVRSENVTEFVTKAQSYAD